MTEPQDSVQKVWQDQPLERIQMPAEVIRKRAARFERRIRWRNLRESMASIIVMLVLGHLIQTTHDTIARTTFALFIAGLAWIVVHLRRRGTAKSLPPGLDTSSSLRFYRAELERERELVASVWSWYLGPLIPGMVVYSVGRAIRSPYPAAWAGLLLFDAGVAATFLLIWKLNMRAARCLERTIAELKRAE